eukprot:jgi/Bigna1/81235/fgenesh1_pg.78_\
MTHPKGGSKCLSARAKARMPSPLLRGWWRRRRSSSMVRVRPHRISVWTTVLSVLLHFCWRGAGQRLTGLGNISPPTSVSTPPFFRFCGVNFTERWLQLVDDMKIATHVTRETDGARCMYGLRRTESGKGIEEFAINEETGESILTQGLSKVVGPFLVRIAGIRRLRPPAVAKLSSLPPHDKSSCSLCGDGMPLRLQLRERIGTLTVPRTQRRWDLHFNISPQQATGHALLVPTLSLEENRRGQALTREDCIDLVLLGFEAGRAGRVGIEGEVGGEEEAGECEGDKHIGHCDATDVAAAASLCVNYNAPGAGASQNHLHAHVWTQFGRYPVDRAALLMKNEWRWSREASRTSKTDEGPGRTRRRRDLTEGGGVTARIVQYPAAAVCFMGEDPIEIGDAVYDVIVEAESRGLTYNLLISGGGRDEAADVVGVYLFLRGRGEQNERPSVLGQRIGAGQMAGEWIIDRPDVFERATESSITEALAQTRPDGKTGACVGND